MQARRGQEWPGDQTTLRKQYVFSLHPHPLSIWQNSWLHQRINGCVCVSWFSFKGPKLTQMNLDLETHVFQCWQWWLMVGYLLIWNSAICFSASLSPIHITAFPKYHATWSLQTSKRSRTGHIVWTFRTTDKIDSTCAHRPTGTDWMPKCCKASKHVLQSHARFQVRSQSVQQQPLSFSKATVLHSRGNVVGQIVMQSNAATIGWNLVEHSNNIEKLVRRPQSAQLSRQRLIEKNIFERESVRNWYIIFCQHEKYN